MSILKSIETDLKEAMKAKDSFRLSVLRMIKAEVKNKEIELIREIQPEEFLALVTKMVKQRQDAAEQYKNGGRADLADKELSEVTVLKVYLPTPLTESELKGLIEAAIQEVGQRHPKAMGQVMQVLKPKTAGRVDGKIVADLVKAALA